MSTHLVLRVVSDATLGVMPTYRAYGPCPVDEATELLKASAVILEGVGLQVHVNPERLIAWRKGTSNTITVVLVPLRPPAEDICEGIF